MNSSSLIVFLIIIIGKVHGSGFNKTSNNNKTNICIDKFKNMSGLKLNLSELQKECDGKKCIAKCCKTADQFYFVDLQKSKTACYTYEKVIAEYNVSLNLDYSVNVFEGNGEHDAEGVQRDLKRDFHFVYNSKVVKGACSSPVLLEPDNTRCLYKNGSLVAVRRNYLTVFVRHWNLGDFCFEHVVVRGRDGVFQQPFITYRYLIDRNATAPPSNPIPYYKPATMLLSCLFLLLVLIVYCLIRELRNINGLVLMAYVATFFLGFFLRTVMFLANRNSAIDSEQCKRMGLVVYFLLLSSFFWMNIMSFDIWWSFRGIFYRCKIHRKGELVKFAWYALYAWGTPLACAVAVGVIEYADLTHRPHFFKPHFEHCFYMRPEDGVVELRYYFYMPMLALIIVNLVFFLLTSFNIWRINRDNSATLRADEDNKKYNRSKNRFCLYLNLSLVMGISWIFEALEMPEYLQMLAGIYNGLTGVAIFIIFICKRRIIRMLCDRVREDLPTAKRYPFTQETSQILKNPLLVKMKRQTNEK